MPAGDEPLLDALERYLRSTTGVVVPREAWDWEKVPEHLRPTYRVVDDAGAEQARGKDLEALKAPLQPAFDAALAEVASDVGLSATGQTTWTFGTIEESVVQRRAGHEVRGFPALVDEGASVGLGVFGSADEAEARHRLGVRRLLLLGMRSVDPLAGLDNAAKLGLAGSPYPTVAELVDDMRAAVAGDGRRCSRTGSGRAGLRGARERARRGGRRPPGSGSFRRAARARRAGGRPRSASAAAPSCSPWPPCRTCARRSARLVDRGFVGEAGPDQLRRYPAYLAAVDHRRERLDGQVARDAQLMAQVADVQEAYLHQVAALPAGRPPGAALRRVRWMLEEYRVSLWAQHLGTAYAVSDQRIRKALAMRPRSGRRDGRPHHRPMTPGDRFFEAIEAGADPAAVAEAADRAATIIVRGARTADQEAIGERLLHLAETEGIETIAELWSGAPADSLAGCLWRLYLLRQWVYADPVARGATVRRRPGPRRGRVDGGRRGRPARPRRAEDDGRPRAARDRGLASSPTCCSARRRSRASSPPVAPCWRCPRREASRMQTLADQLERAARLELEHQL